MAGRLEQTCYCKTSNDFYKLQISFSTFSQHIWRQLLLRQVSHFSATFLQQNLDFTKTKKKANFVSNSLAQIWLEIGHNLNLRNSPQWKTYTWTRTKKASYRPTVELMVTDALAKEWLWLLTQIWSPGVTEPCLKFSVVLALVQTELHLKPLTSIQCNLKWIQLDPIKCIPHSVLLSSIIGT